MRQIHYCLVRHPYRKWSISKQTTLYMNSVGAILPAYHSSRCTRNIIAKYPNNVYHSPHVYRACGFHLYLAVKNRQAGLSGLVYLASCSFNICQFRIEIEMLSIRCLTTFSGTPRKRAERHVDPNKREQNRYCESTG